MVQATSTAKSNLMNRAILMNPNRTKHCVYGYIYSFSPLNLSSLVPISLPNHQDLMEQWLACLIYNLRIHGSSPSTAKSKSDQYILFVCLCVCWYLIPVKTIKPIGPKICVGSHMNQGRFMVAQIFKKKFYY